MTSISKSSIVVCLLYICSWNSNNAESYGGAILLIEWYYSNPAHTLADGRDCDRFGHNQCDVRFRICLRNAAAKVSRREDECGLLRYNIETMTNTGSVKMQGENAIKINIPQPVPNLYTFKMIINEDDVIGSDELIGSFQSEKFGLTPSIAWAELNLSSPDRRLKNDRLKVKVRINLRCLPFFYGNHCDRECHPQSNKYTCGSDGTKICETGFHGTECDRVDACQFEACAEHAICENKEDGSGRVCICNGKEAPECYPGFDPCSSTQCYNNGKCHPTGPYKQSVRCECTESWTGYLCTERRLACLEKQKELNQYFNGSDNDTLRDGNMTIPVCLNGGKCLEYSDRFAFRCACTSNWKGIRCEIPESIHFNIIVIILIIFCALFFACMVTFIVLKFLYNRRKYKLREKLASGCGAIVYYYGDGPDINRDTGNFTMNAIYGNADAPNQMHLSYLDRGTRPNLNISRTDYDCYDALGIHSGSDRTVYSDITPLMDSFNSTIEAALTDEPAPPLPDRPHELQPMKARCEAIGDIEGITNSFGSRVVEDHSPISPSNQTLPRIYRPTRPNVHAINSLRL